MCSRNYELRDLLTVEIWVVLLKFIAIKNLVFHEFVCFSELPTGLNEFGSAEISVLKFAVLLG